MMNLEMKIEMFAKVLESDHVKEILRYSPCIANVKNCKAVIKPGRKYTKVDLCGCGYYMIDNDGNIFGIKGYGVVNKNHYFGTLDTINQYNWGGHRAYKLKEARDLNSEYLTTVEETVNILEAAEQEKQKIKNELLESEINFEPTPEDNELLNVEIIEESPEVEEIQLNKNTVEFVNVDSLNINIQAKFPKLNKNDSLQDNDESINKYGFDLEPCKVKRIIFLTNKQYDYFSNNLLNSYDFMDRGGHNMTTNYVNVVVSTGKKILIVNPEGYKYCRYTGYIQNDYHNSLHNAIEELDPFTESEDSKQLTKALEEFYYMLTGETPPTPEVEEEPQQENTNVISLDSFRNKKAAKQEIKQTRKNNKIVMCVCGSIIPNDLEEYKNIGICPNCINNIMEKFDNGTLKAENPELYNMIAEGLKTN